MTMLDANEAECVTCGTITPTEDGRCPRCSKALPQLQRRAVAATATAPPIEGKIRLPDSMRARRWKRLTRELVSELASETERLQAQSADAKRQANDARKAHSLIQQIAALIADAPVAPSAARGADGGVVTRGLWAKNHAACVQCGTTERKHMARGLCSRCYVPKYGQH